MKAFFKSKKGIALIVSLLVVTLIGVGVGCYFIFRKKLKYDYVKGARAVNIVENAQYAPDMDKFIEANSAIQGVSTLKNGFDVKTVNSIAEETTSNMTVDEFADLIEEYGLVDNYAGVGKYDGYHIYEIKNEIKYVVEHVPAFNQWFRMPDMRSQQGYPYIPYYEWWAYYLDIDEQNRLSITRVSYTTSGSGYIDFSTNSTMNLNFAVYEVMKTNYYFDENGDEVVECYFYCVGVDNVVNALEYNSNPKDSYPLEYMYLKNVKDKSLIKYHFTVAKRYLGGIGNPYYGYDLRGLTPYGIRREVLIANYDGYTQVDVTKIDQQFATLTNPEYDGIVNFNMNSNNIKELVNNIGLSREEYESSTDCMVLLDKIAKQVIDNFGIKNSWMSIFKNAMSAHKIKLIKGPLYGKENVFDGMKYSIACNNNKILCNAEANIINMAKFDRSKQYSFSCAMRNKQSGNLYVLACNYKNLAVGAAYFAGGVNFNTSTINIPENGEYEFTIVVTEEINGKDIIIHDTKVVLAERIYKGLTIPNSIDESGVEHQYQVKGGNGELKVIVSNV